MINEANEPSSACRLWRILQVETSTPPATTHYCRGCIEGQGMDVLPRTAAGLNGQRFYRLVGSRVPGALEPSVNLFGYTAD